MFQTFLFSSVHLYLLFWSFSHLVIWICLGFGSLGFRICLVIEIWDLVLLFPSSIYFVMLSSVYPVPTHVGALGSAGCHITTVNGTLAEDPEPPISSGIRMTE